MIPNSRVEVLPEIFPRLGCGGVRLAEGGANDPGTSGPRDRIQRHTSCFGYLSTEGWKIEGRDMSGAGGMGGCEGRLHAHAQDDYPRMKRADRNE